VHHCGTPLQCTTAVHFKLSCSEGCFAIWSFPRLPSASAMTQSIGSHLASSSCWRLGRRLLRSRAAASRSSLAVNGFRSWLSLSHASCYVACVYYLRSKQSSQQSGVGGLVGACPPFPFPSRMHSSSCWRLGRRLLRSRAAASRSSLAVSGFRSWLSLSRASCYVACVYYLRSRSRAHSKVASGGWWALAPLSHFRVTRAPGRGTGAGACPTGHCRLAA
jgi:hypothetical protein